MLIEQRMRFMKEGYKFDTEKLDLKCVSNPKYGDIDLCFCEPDGNGSNIAFAEIKLYGSGLAKDADATFDSAVALGNEIARRWNESKDGR